MRTKQGIAHAARKLADRFSNLPAEVTAETTASAAYVFGLVGYVAQELAEMVRDLTEVDASDVDHGDAAVAASSRSACRDVDHGVEYLNAVIAVLRADLEEADEKWDALKVEVRDARKEIARRDDLLKVVLAARLKHGPGGRGDDGPCDPDCLKCAVEVYRRKDL